MDFYTLRERSVDEILPWDYIDTGITKKFLAREYDRAKKGIVTPNCRQACGGCGCTEFNVGVCIEPKSRSAQELEY